MKLNYFETHALELANQIEKLEKYINSYQSRSYNVNAALGLTGTGMTTQSFIQADIVRSMIAAKLSDKPQIYIIEMTGLFWRLSPSEWKQLVRRTIENGRLQIPSMYKPSSRIPKEVHYIRRNGEIQYIISPNANLKAKLCQPIEWTIANFEDELKEFP